MTAATVLRKLFHQPRFSRADWLEIILHTLAMMAWACWPRNEYIYEFLGINSIVAICLYPIIWYPMIILLRLAALDSLPHLFGYGYDHLHDDKTIAFYLFWLLRMLTAIILVMSIKEVLL